MRVCAIQMAHGETIEDNLRRAREKIREAADAGARLALLPEYFFAPFPRPDDAASAGGPPAAVPHAAAIRAALAEASRDSGIAVAGNVLEEREGRLRNYGVVYEGGSLVLEQPKLHPMPREAASGVVGGERLLAAPVGGHATGMLVCADVLYPETGRILALKGAEVLLNPVMSPWRADDDGREARVAMYVARAYDNGAFVLKAAGLAPGRIAGRSLITAPWGVLARAKDDFTEELLYADLNFERLRVFRGKQAEFPARRPEAYEGLL